MTLRIQKDLLARLEATIKAGRDRIANVDTGLKSEVRRERIEAIRGEVAKSLQATAADMASRAKAARDGISVWSQDAVRRRAKFSDDPAVDAAQRSAFFQTLCRAPTGALVEYLKDATRTNNLAAAEAVRLEFHSRPDTTQFAQEFGSAFGLAIDPAAQNLEAELRQIDGLAEFGLVRMREFLTDRPDPVGRLAAAREAGMVTTSEVKPDPAERAAALQA